MALQNIADFTETRTWGPFLHKSYIKQDSDLQSLGPNHTYTVTCPFFSKKEANTLTTWYWLPWSENLHPLYTGRPMSPPVLKQKQWIFPFPAAGLQHMRLKQHFSNVIPEISLILSRSHLGNHLPKVLMLSWSMKSQNRSMTSWTCFSHLPYEQKTHSIIPKEIHSEATWLYKNN